MLTSLEDLVEIVNYGDQNYLTKPFYNIFPQPLKKKLELIQD